ncbi:hypothetical protein BKA56DRAFT_626119 [Ilyonectria sp. MPI-CAGE-AT-0026]|nr:hypothetical protein BKA56DRAFT_626119 [Ilyonectria sp. MPI-CAGE-AT-0026]
MRDSFAHCLTAIEALKHDQREAQREFTACDASEREAQESVVNFEAHMKSLLDQEMGQRMDREQAELEINAYPAAVVLADVGLVVITALGYDGLDQLISLGEDVDMDD